jgi:hypothetical protein
VGKAARAAHRRQRLHAPHGEGEIAVMVGWCKTEADLPETRKQTHDRLIEMMGDRRTGGVTWRWWTGEQAVEALERLKEGASGGLADYYRRISAHLREWDGFVVMASAPGRPAWVDEPIGRHPFDEDEARRAAGRAQYGMGDELDDPNRWVGPA